MHIHTYVFVGCVFTTRLPHMNDSRRWSTCYAALCCLIMWLVACSNRFSVSYYTLGGCPRLLVAFSHVSWFRWLAAASGVHLLVVWVHAFCAASVLSRPCLCIIKSASTYSTIRLCFSSFALHCVCVWISTCLRKWEYGVLWSTSIEITITTELLTCYVWIRWYDDLWTNRDSSVESICIALGRWYHNDLTFRFSVLVGVSLSLTLPRAYCYINGLLTDSIAIKCSVSRIPVYFMISKSQDHLSQSSWK